MAPAKASRLLAVQLALLAAGIVLLVLVWLDVTTVLRSLLALVFLGAGPGAALVWLFRLDEVWATVSLAIALSLVIDVAVAQTMVWTGNWAPRAGLLVLLLVTAVAVAGHAILNACGSAATDTAGQQ